MIAWLINDDALADMEVSFGWAEITVTSETSHCVTQGCNSFCEWVNIKIKNTHTEHLTELRWSVISTVSMLSDSGISTLSEWSSCKLSHSRQYLLNCHMLVSQVYRADEGQTDRSIWPLAAIPDEVMMFVVLLCHHQCIWYTCWRSNRPVCLTFSRYCWLSVHLVYLITVR